MYLLLAFAYLLPFVFLKGYSCIRFPFLVLKDLAAFLGTLIGFTGSMFALGWVSDKIGHFLGYPVQKYFAVILLGITLFFAVIFCFGPGIMFKLLRKFF